MTPFGENVHHFPFLSIVQDLKQITVYAKPSSYVLRLPSNKRYLGRPVIALSRIDKYDGSHGHSAAKPLETIHSFIRYIPEKHFKAMAASFHKVISKQKRPILRNFNH